MCALKVHINWTLNNKILSNNNNKDKLHIWSLSFTPYFNLVPNLSIESIGSLTFQYRVNLIPTVISWMEKSYVSNRLIRNCQLYSHSILKYL